MVASLRRGPLTGDSSGGGSSRIANGVCCNFFLFPPSRACAVCACWLWQPVRAANGNPKPSENAARWSPASRLRAASPTRPEKLIVVDQIANHHVGSSCLSELPSDLLFFRPDDQAEAQRFFPPPLSAKGLSDSRSQSGAIKRGGALRRSDASVHRALAEESQCDSL